MKRLHQLKFFSIPILLAISFPLMLYSRNLGQIPVRQIILPISIVVAATLGFSYIVNVIMRSSWKSTVIVSGAILIFFTYTDVLAMVGQSPLFRIISFASPSVQLFIVNVVCIISLFLVIYRLRKTYDFLIVFLGIFSVIATTFPLVLISSYFIKNNYYSPKSKLELPSVRDTGSTAELPDIYYIVPDTHASSAIMNQYYGYDMTKFVEHLEKAGFYHLGRSTSNYPKTLSSLASSLNMEYLDYLSDISPSDDETLVYTLIEDNNVLKFLKNLGYSYYQLGSWWPSTRANRQADRNIVMENEYLISVNGFTYALLSMTMARPFITEHLSQFFLGESEDNKLSRILYQFSKVEEVARLPGPKFVFFHIIAPHSPYVLDKFCTAIDPGYSKTRTSMVNYAEQAECIDTKLTSMIDTIQRVSSYSAVIVLQSDEGADIFGGNDRWTEVPPEAIKSKFPILHAVYFPGMSSVDISQTMTPVNTFRFIFNAYFQTNFPLLPDKNYIYQDKNNIYKYIDVTEIVQEK